MESLGKAIGFLFTLTITAIVGMILFGGYIIFNWFKGEVIESPKRIEPEIELITDGKKIDTLYIYKLK
jgi:hypothetical protein